jgi:anti-anti-sigma regulatory factor
MLTVHTDRIGDVAVIECQGRLVRSEAAFAVRNAVMSQKDAHTIVLDLSELAALEGGGLGMLLFLQRWAHDHDIRLKLFNPGNAVLNKLATSDALSAFELANTHEIAELLEVAQNHLHASSFLSEPMPVSY